MATFARASTAYKQDGTSVSSGVARYETAKFGQGLMGEEGTTNILSANQSSVETDATGFLTGPPYLNTGATISRDTTIFWQDLASLKVVCDGTLPSQGFWTSDVAATVGDISSQIRLKGSGTVKVRFASTTPFVYNDQTITLTTDWQTIKNTITIPTGGSTTVGIQVYTTSAQAVTFYADGLQIEQKSYQTSWQIGGTPRSAETVTIPNTAFNKSNWCVESTPRPTSAQIVTGKTGYLWENYIDANNYYAVKVDANGRAYLEVKSGGTVYTASSTSIPQMVAGTDYPIAVKGNGSLMAIFVNRVKYAEVSYVEPVGTLLSDSYLGSDHNGANHANAIYDDTRISTYRQDADLTSDYTVTLPVDQYTTAKLAFDGDLVTGIGIASTLASDSTLIANLYYALSATLASVSTLTTKTTKSFYQAVADAPTEFFSMGSKCYIMDGTNFLSYDGTTVSQVTPYVPTLTLGRPPAGGGTPNEDFNLLGAGFKDSFSGVATTTIYQLSLTNLDATLVTAVVNGVNKVETTDFTVNRTTGVVTFTTAPGVGTNNVVITAYKTVAGFADRIKKCTKAVIFGGTNDSRAFVYGNPSYPNYLFYCGIYDPTYWPENGFNKIGLDTGAIKKIVKQYDICVIMKEKVPNDTPIWSMSYLYDTTISRATFPIKPVNDELGYVAGAETINNNPTWLSDKGIYSLKNTTVRDERNAHLLSQRVNPKLLKELNQTTAVSADYNGRYFLVVNNNAYVYDYQIDEWYLYDNIPAGRFVEKDGYLYFGSKTSGIVYKFKKATDSSPYNDDGQAINAYWKSKITSFGADERKKLIEKVFVGLAPAGRSSADLSYMTNIKDSGVIKTAYVNLFSYAAMNYANFTYRTSKLPQEIAAKIKAKKVSHFQTIVQNNKINENFGIVSVGVKYQYQNEYK